MQIRVIVFSGMAFLSVSGITKHENGNVVVASLSFIQQSFQHIAIAGETGSGKTTVLKMIAGLLQADSGEIMFNEKKVKGPYEKLIPGHTEIAYLSQHFELRNNYYVHEIVDYANKLSQTQAADIFSVCRVQHLLSRRTEQLSGGEKQRIALAKLLITAPKLLLLDEPFSNLDIIHRNIIKEVIKDIGDKLGITSIMVSHDAEDMLSWADEIIIMKEGKIVQQGNPEGIYYHPANEYCAALFGEYNVIAAGNDRKILLRPEHFILATESNSRWSGIVNAVRFHGSYSIADINIKDGLLKVLAPGKQIKPGDKIHLALSPELNITL